MLQTRIPRPLIVPLAAACIALATLAGCAAQKPAPAPVAQGKVSLIAAQNAQTRALAALYRKSLTSDAGLRPVLQRMALNPNEATPAMLADPERISAAQKPLLREVARRQADYQEHMAALLRGHRIDAALVDEWEAGARAGATLRAQLHNGAITWGEYNTRLREVNSAQRMALSEIADALEAHDAAAAARAAGEAHAIYAAALGQTTANAGGGACETIGGEPYCS